MFGDKSHQGRGGILISPQYSMALEKSEESVDFSKIREVIVSRRTSIEFSVQIVNESDL